MILILVVTMVGCQATSSSPSVLSQQSPPAPSAVLNEAGNTLQEPSATPETTSLQTTTTTLPRFEPADCEFDVSPALRVECGFLYVKEDRADPNSPTISLHVAIFKSFADQPEPDPVIYLAGGGGHDHLDSYELYLTNGGQEILQNRDYIMYNQRGARYNTPYLDCEGLTRQTEILAGENLPRTEFDERYREALLHCYEILKSGDYDLSAYNSTTNAADVNDLRLALGYEQVNLYGTSYGTRVALNVMRDFPEGIRSVIIDSVYPPQISYLSSYAINTQRVFKTLFEDCAASSQCNSRYPELEKIFYQTVESLDENPVELQVRRVRSGAATSESLWVDGVTFMDAIYLMFYIPSVLPTIPSMVQQANEGDLTNVQWAIEANLNHDSIAEGVHFSFQCREEIAFDTAEEATANAASLEPVFAKAYTDYAMWSFTLCDSWDTGGADPIENQAVISDIPTLIFAGRYDPITPPGWGWLAGETLSNSFFYEFPNVGHGVMRADRCAQSIGQQFIADPSREPDASCMQTLSQPAFR
jgi:pimeloyl-ACP methyl ester carboxylesterase